MLNSERSLGYHHDYHNYHNYQDPEGKQTFIHLFYILTRRSSTWLEGERGRLHTHSISSSSLQEGVERTPKQLPHPLLRQFSRLNSKSRCFASGLQYMGQSVPSFTKINVSFYYRRSTLCFTCWTDGCSIIYHAN